MSAPAVREYTSWPPPATRQRTRLAWRVPARLARHGSPPERLGARAGAVLLVLGLDTRLSTG
jgi:hypothetical protein